MIDAMAQSRADFPFATMSRCGGKTRSGSPCQRIGNKRNGRCKMRAGQQGDKGAFYPNARGLWRPGDTGGLRGRS